MIFYLALAVISAGILAYEVLLVQVREHGVAFLDLAFSDEPEVERSPVNPRLAAGVELGLQRQAIQLCDVLALVILLVNTLEFLELPAARKVQCVSIAKLSRGTQRAVLRQKLVNVSRVVELLSQVSGAQVGPQDVVFEELLLVLVETVYCAPVAELDLVDDTAKQLPLLFDD